ncbi:ferredoxin [Streptomyces sp. TBY4]|uniref:ferredoxin n=1 Tax=Streptomyces sp. TBY4 TaxID=2962030 RepID=UPI0020B7C5A2|nr:ferredoxin [Streptomyces sp. TBY4]MCP3758699.1 ferredoxin [Streptomyces sp. TBY4]
MAWDPVGELTDDERSSFERGGERPERLWLNVPGPFWTGMTDNCWTGRMEAPDNVLYTADSLYCTEYVFRQPRNPAEVRALSGAAWADPFGEYFCDGDLRWTPAEVREWWAGRGRVAEHLAESLADFGPGGSVDDEEVAAGVREFQGYLDDGLAVDLRAYLFRLEEGRYPEAGERLPQL